MSLAFAPPHAVATARPSGAAAAPGGARAARVFTWAAIVAMFALSAMALTAFGIPYATTGGSLLTKIHPATWLATLAVGLTLLGPGGPSRRLARVAIASPGVVIFGVTIVLLFVQVAVVLRLPLSQMIDTYVLPIFLFVALGDFDRPARRSLALALHAIIAVDAALGLVEYASGWRLTPMYDIDGSIIVDWRSTAIFGHPLNNAFIVGLWLVTMASGGGREMSRMVRLMAMALAAMSLVAFGGRVALVMAIALVAVIAMLRATTILAGRRFDLTGAAIALAAGTAFLVLGVMALDAGAADRLLERFVDDAGSAGTRIAMFHIFGDLTWGEFVLGPPIDHMVQAQREYGIKIGIESTEVAFVAFYGLAMAIVLLAGIGAHLVELVRATSRASLWAVVFFVVVMSASTGLSSKSTNLAMFTVMVLTMMPRAGDPAAAAVARDRR